MNLAVLRLSTKVMFSTKFGFNTDNVMVLSMLAKPQTITYMYVECDLPLSLWYVSMEYLAVLLEGGVQC